MVFHSFQFLLFFMVVVTAYYAALHKTRRLFLLVAGYFFYFCFKPEYLLLLIAATAADYFLAIAIHTNNKPKKKKFLLIVGLVENIGLLFLFKYFNLFNATLREFFNGLNVFYNIPGIYWLLPVGISYYTFKKISYLVDVYRETIPPEKSPVSFALYVSFFPEIMAGPIDRAGKLLPQFKKKIHFDYQQVTEGLKLMAWGFFKKLVIADRLSLFVEKVYGDPTQYQGLSLIIATLYFSIQIYCDFSGYTDIAVGVGKVLGFQLTENFNRPYFASSIGDFWKRWHISLSSWLMDYLFLPIAYAVSRRIKKDRVLRIKAETWAYVCGILITFLICGLWHGARWTFLLWGGIHGVFLAVSFATKKIRKRVNKKISTVVDRAIPGKQGTFQWKRSYLRKILRIVFTFSLVTIAWVFFKAGSISDAFYIITNMFAGWATLTNIDAFYEAITFGLWKKELLVAALSIGFVFLVHILRRGDRFEMFISRKKIVVRWMFYLVILVAIIVFGHTGAADFIYFNF